MGRRGIFSPYPFSPLWASGPFIAGRVLRGVRPGCGVRTTSDVMGQNNTADAVIMVIVGVEASVHL
jgi:hypothetical protein